MTDCAAPRHDGQDEPAEAEAHSTLCRPCRLGLSADLRRLPGLHADLDHIPAQRGGDGTGLPFSEPAADCRSQIRRNVVRSVLFVAGERHIPQPPDYLAAMCAWLIPHVGWCSFREEAPFMADAFRKTRARAAALADPWIITQFPLPVADRACLECDSGQMWVTIYVYASDSRKSAVWCTNPECGARWEFGGAWLPFVRQVIRRRQAVAG